MTTGVNKRRQNRQRAVAASDETLHAARRETVEDIWLPVLRAFFILMRGSVCRFAGFFLVVFFLFSAGASDVAHIARRHTQLRCEREQRQEEDQPLGFLPRTNAESNPVVAVV